MADPSAPNKPNCGALADGGCAPPYEAPPRARPPNKANGCCRSGYDWRLRIWGCGLATKAVAAPNKANCPGAQRRTPCPRGAADPSAPNKANLRRPSAGNWEPAVPNKPNLRNVKMNVNICCRMDCENRNALEAKGNKANIKVPRRPCVHELCYRTSVASPQAPKW